MTEFLKYPKIHRYGLAEVEGILDSPVTIQEKIDGANVSIWLNENGEVRCGTRNRELPSTESFNGFQDYVYANPNIEKWCREHPNLRLYGEWLVPHTIRYPENAYHKIYLFDIYNNEDELFATQTLVERVASELGLEYPKIFVRDETMTLEQVKQYVGMSVIGDGGEGVVIKNETFVNRFGNFCYAKIVHENFKEQNKVAFGGNDKSLESYEEIKIMNKYCSHARVVKIMNKVQCSTDEPLGMKHTPRIAESCYYDLITEDMWEIIKKPMTINFKTLKGLCMKKFVRLYHEELTGEN
jgi:disulfide oxidoreductase YuzD